MAGRPSSHEIVKECIFTSLMLLMEKKDYNKITVTEIAKKAGVSRMAYYRVYGSKEDIIDTHLDDIFDDMIRRIHQKEISSEEDLFRCFFNCIAQNITLFRNVMRAGLLEIVWRKMKEKMVDIFCIYFALAPSAPLFHYNISFVTGGFLHLAGEWVRTDMADDVETMVELCCSIAERLKRAAEI